MTQNANGAAAKAVDRLPKALAFLIRCNDGWAWIVPMCPHCGAAHGHVAGKPAQDPRMCLGYADAPCVVDRPLCAGYILVAAEDKEALRLIAEFTAAFPDLDVQPRALMHRDKNSTQGRPLWLSDDGGACCATCRFGFATKLLRKDGNGRIRTCRHKPGPRLPHVDDDHVCLNYATEECDVVF